MAFIKDPPDDEINSILHEKPHTLISHCLNGAGLFIAVISPERGDLFIQDQELRRCKGSRTSGHRYAGVSRPNAWSWSGTSMHEDPEYYYQDVKEYNFRDLTPPDHGIIEEKKRSVGKRHPFAFFDNATFTWTDQFHIRLPVELDYRYQ
ncbi:hypothetical protein TWF506_004505 [Arthrobotrys conoides]|uniref:Uncharacterized protein n=1 Tax=Arthrobotrys conoides TaxID=74498 RepID=A0AAN8RTK7_9PEZI